MSVDDLLPGIVRILGVDDQTVGTGFLTTDDGLIATCSHVICAAGVVPGETICLVFQAIGEKREATVEPSYWSDPEAEDVAILRLKGVPPAGVNPLALGTSLGLGRFILSTFGFPEAKPDEGLPGLCEVIGNTTNEGIKVLVLKSNEISYGFSGAPLWDNNSQTVVGIVASIVPSISLQDDNIRPFDSGGRQTETAFGILVETVRSVCSELYLTDTCPYRGLNVFEDKHAEFYFGRDAAIQELIEKLVRHHFVAVVGISGSGKSSLVQAGLIKGLQKSSIPGLANLPRCLFRPGNNPLLNLVQSFSHLPGQSLEKIAHGFEIFSDLDLSLEKDNVVLSLDEKLSAISSIDLANKIHQIFQHMGVLIVVDQFEHLYSECQDENVRLKFIEVLLALVDENIKCLITLRTDFYGIALENYKLATAIKSGQLTLVSMSDEDLVQVITKPAQLLRRNFQPGLVERLVFDVQDRPGDLPLLEFALAELWKKDSMKGVLTISTYKALGYSTPDDKNFDGVQGAVAQYAELIWKELSESEQKATRFIFLQLVTPGVVDEQGKQLTKDISRQAWKFEWDKPTSQKVVEKLIAARLLTKGQNFINAQPTIEVAHEALIRAWPRLQRWIKECQPFLEWYVRELAPRMYYWIAEQKDSSYLLPAQKLGQANQWLDEYSNEISEIASEYIQTSLKLHNRQEFENKQRKAWFVRGLITVLLIVSMLAGVAVFKWQESEVRQISILTESSNSYFNLDKKFDALLVALRAAKNLKSVYLHGEGTKAQLENSLRQSVFGVSECNRLTGHQKGVTSVSFSPGGQTIASTSADGTVKLWNKNGRELHTLEGHTGWVLDVDFGSDGQTIASASTDKTIILWSSNGQKLHVLKGHNGSVLSVSFSPDGQTIASASADDTVKLWNKNGEELSTFKGHKDTVTSVDFSPDGQTIASASKDGTIRIWSTSGAKTNKLEAHSNWVYSIKFSPDGKRLASASRDGTIKIWSIDGQLLDTLKGHRDRVYSVNFSPDGKRLASASRDGTIKIWSIDGQLLNTLKGHEINVTGASFSPDGKVLASAGADGMVRLWSLADQSLQTFRGHKGWVRSINFNSSGETLVSTGADGLVKLWDVAGKDLNFIQKESDWVRNASFSPNDELIATANADGTVTVWTLSGQEIKVFNGHKNNVIDVDFSPSGETIASASLDKTLKLWSLNKQEFYTLVGHQDWVFSVKFSPDGQTLTSASDDSTIKLWSLNGRLIHTFTGHGYGVYSVSFSPDGRSIASASGDGTVKLWRLDEKLGEQEPKTFRGHNGGVLDVKFSPDGKLIASASRDGTVKFWDLDGRELSTLRGHTDQVRSLSFSPNGKVLASASDDGTIKTWSTEISNFDQLLSIGCSFVNDYLKNNSDVNQQDRLLCNDINEFTNFR
ncbi:MAG: trypsin-like peptidase domain-containing protein [Tildeniella nuda ZEHNDER 1965/U140]|jgi:WD40 repeat protein|nr:trypsin-like peptidase domain-containing protein [Tildeniella nuda ZEHNDER 1965/U140]